MAQAVAVTLKAPDISCGHCVSAIKKAVGELPGVASVDADAATKLVSVSFDPDVASVDKIAAAMAEEGYPVVR